MRNLPIFVILMGLKSVSRLFWKPGAKWVGQKPKNFKDVKVFALLNHTSLFEPLLVGAFPTSLVREMSRRMIYPVADKTYNRPIAGRFFRLLAPGTVSLTRSRDESWKLFTEMARNQNALVGIAPEGRMKRPNGLDRHGRPMNMKTGIADLLNDIDSGQMLLLYSGGLHHIQKPGNGFPKLFKKISIKFEVVDIATYKKQLQAQHPDKPFPKQVTSDLERRRDMNCEDIQEMTTKQAGEAKVRDQSRQNQFLGDHVVSGLSGQQQASRS